MGGEGSRRLWRPLWELNETEAAARDKTEAEADTIRIDAGVISPDEVRRMLAADADCRYHGLDPDDLPPPPVDPSQEADPEHEPEAAPAQDADFKESDHPRADNGQFGSGGGAPSSAEEASHGAASAAKVDHRGESSAVTAAHADALKSYTGAGYREVNGHLRGGKAISADGERQIAALDSLLNSARTRADSVVFRGLGSLAVTQLLGPSGKVRRGDILTDAGFPSASSSEGVARSFVNVNKSKNVLMRIKMPSGSNALDVSKYSDIPGEAETIIARGAQLRVVKFDPKSRTLEVELMPHDHTNQKGSGHAKMAADAAAERDRTDKFGYADAAGLSITRTEDDAADEIDLTPKGGW